MIMLSKHAITIFVLFAFIVHDDGIVQIFRPKSFLAVPVLAYMITTTPSSIRGTYRSLPALFHEKQHVHLQKNVHNIQLRASVSTVAESNYDIVKESNMNSTKSTIRGTIQILMSDTGGGHRASAYAIRDALEVLYPGGQIYCDIVDIYTEYGPIWPYNDYVSIYKYMAANPWMWEILYNFGKSDFGLWFNQIMLEIFCTNAFKECLCRLQPITCTDATTTNNTNKQRRADMIVSVHPLTQDLPLKIVEQLDQMNGGTNHRTTPFCTVVTDLGSAHPTWFNPGVDKCFVPSDALYNAALQRKLQPSQIVQYGLPIRKGFWSLSTSSSENGSDGKIPTLTSSSKQLLRQQLGLNDTLPVVLVVGGGDGMGGIVEISKRLGYELGRLQDREAATPTSTTTTKPQMVVICGKNQNAKYELERVNDWGNDMIVHIKGFVNNMDEYMKASDVLVTKAGPGTIAEASICGLPCMMFSYLPGQEEGNIPFVENAGFGKYSSDPNVIANLVSEWISSPEKLQRMQQAAYSVSRPNATLDIAKDIAGMLFQHLKV